MQRIENWHTALTALINSRRNIGFFWGSNDCALWAADCVLAITGEDFAKKVRGTYDTPTGAFKALVKYYNSDNVKEVFAKILEESNVSHARPGDVVYKNSNYEGFNAAMGICYGRHSFFVSEEAEGLMQVETLSLDGCFKVA